jgi:hypothetical protein
MNNTEQADGKGKRSDSYHQFIKRKKRRLERRKANRDPETPPTYGKYSGYET